MLERFYELRDYQKEGIDEIISLRKQGHLHILRQQPTATGKSLEIIEFAVRAINKGNPVLICVPYPHLVDNLERYLLKMGVQPDIIQGNRKVKNPHKLVTIACVPTLVKRIQKGEFKFDPKLMLMDECFPWDTKVDGKNISEINIGDWVTSFDPDTGVFAKKRVTHVFKNPLKVLYKLRLVNGRELIATGNHPVWTQRGFVDVQDLTTQDEVFCYGQDLQFKQSSLQELRKKGGIHRDVKIKTRFYCSLRGKLSLFTCLLQRVSKKKIIRNSYENEQNLCKRSDAAEQPDAQAGDPSKSKRYSFTTGSQALFAGREWQAHINSPSTSFRRIKKCSSRSTLGARRSDWNGENETHFDTGGTVSQSLQDGYSLQSGETCDRGRRDKSSVFQSSERGLQESYILSRHRVQDVTLFQSGSDVQPGSGDPRNFVYNLEIEDWHTYVADGVCVHNCHHLKSDTWYFLSQKFKDRFSIYWTATPERLDKQGFDDVCTAIVLGKQVQWFMDNGYMPQVRYLESPLERTEGGKTILAGKLVDTWLENAENFPTLVFASTKDESKAIVKAYNDMARERYGREIAIHIDGDMPKKYVKNVLAAFGDRVTIISSVNMINEGADLPDCWCVQLASYSDSTAQVVQRWGRVLRWQEGKTAVVLDHVAICQKHGYPADYREWGLKGLVDPEKIKLFCYHCGSLMARDKRKVTGETMTCPHCSQVNFFERESRAEGVTRGNYTLEPDVALVEVKERSQTKNIQRILKKREQQQNKEFWAVYQALLVPNLELPDWMQLCIALKYKPNYANRLFHIYKIIHTDYTKMCYDKVSLAKALGETPDRYWKTYCKVHRLHEDQ